MAISPSNNPYGNTELVDRLIGTAYDTVKLVAENLQYVKHVSVNLPHIAAVSEGIDSIKVVEAHLDQIVAVAADIANIDNVSENIISVNAVANQMTALLALYQDLTQVLAVAANLAEVVAVGEHITAVQGVFDNIQNIEDMLEALPDLEAVLAQKDEILTAVSDAEAARDLAQQYAQEALENSVGLSIATDEETIEGVITNKATTPHGVHAAWDAWKGEQDALTSSPKSFIGIAGNNKDYLLDVEPSSTSKVIVFVGGSYQVPGTHYTLSGSTLTILSNPDGLDVDTLAFGGSSFTLTEILDAKDIAVAAKNASEAARDLAEQYAAEAENAVIAIATTTFFSVALAAAATISASVKRIRTDYFAPNLVAPKTLVGGASYRRISFVALSGYPAASYFRSADRFMPDGTTDATNGGYWLLDHKRPSAHMTGALGDGVTDDLNAINAALAYTRLQGGGEVDLFPTGAAYLISNSIVVGDGVKLSGSATTTFPGTTAPKADWTKYGTWINPTHSSNAGVILQGHGSGIRGVCFWHNQPTPTGGIYTPNPYGWAIEVRASHTTVEDINIVCGTNGIILNYTSTSGGGTHVALRNLIVSCFGTCLNTTNVNDTFYLENFHARPLWQTGFITTTYFKHLIAWDCGYTDNVIVNGFEAVFGKIGIYFRNQTCLDNTHSLYNAQISGLQLSLCETAMKVENANAVVTGQINDLVVQQGDMFGFTWSNECFTLDSDYLDLMISSLRINDAGGQIGTLGHGVGGKLKIGILDVRQYSSITPSQVGWAVNSNFKLDIDLNKMRKITTAGARFAGAGSDGGVHTGSYAVIKEPFGRFSELDVTAGTNGWMDIGTDSLFRPGMTGVTQLRLIADMNIVASGSGNIQLRFSTLPESLTAAISASSTGWKSFDTGWVDIAQSTLDALATVGRPQININSGVRVQNGAFILLVR